MFVLGIVTASFTKIRIPNMSIGVSEVLLLISIILSFFKIIFTSKLYYNDARWFILLWSLTFPCLLAGIFTHITIVHPVDPVSLSHDGIAFIFCFFSIALFWLAEIDSRDTLLKILKSVYHYSSLVFTLMLLLVLLGLDIPVYSLYDSYNIRFTGLSLNPNQLALFVLPLFFFGEYLYKTKKSIIYYLWMIPIVSIGFLTLSDSLYLAWGIFAGIYYMFFKKYSNNTQKDIFIRISFILILILSLVVVVSVLYDYYESISSGSSQGSERINRWSNALRAILISPLWGYGPGSFSGTTGIWQSQEAHNTVIDWTLSTGIFGVIFLLGYWFLIFVTLLKYKQNALLMSFFGLFLFTMFHYVLRQPVYWFYTLILLGLSRDFNSRTIYLTKLKG